tara:strand:- start:285 stop:605 length:321 start_codon:yes stop_codon:yes gene_type:complete
MDSIKLWTTHLGEKVIYPQINSDKFSIGNRRDDQYADLAVEIDEFKYMIQLGFKQDGFEIMLILINTNNWNHIENIDKNFNANGRKISPFALKFIKDIVMPKLMEP